MITLESLGEYAALKNYLIRLLKGDKYALLDKYGQIGVKMLHDATPVDTGKTADSWSYRIEHKDGQWCLWFENSNINKGVPIAVILQYGHGTGTGGWVEGRDYINPVIRPVYMKILQEIRTEIFKSGSSLFE